MSWNAVNNERERATKPYITLLTEAELRFKFSTAVLVVVSIYAKSNVTNKMQIFINVPSCFVHCSTLSFILYCASRLYSAPSVHWLPKTRLVSLLPVTHSFIQIVEFVYSHAAYVASYPLLKCFCYIIYTVSLILFHRSARYSMAARTETKRYIEL